MKKVLLYISFLYLCLELMQSCANISSPSGGPMDTVPPGLVNTYPIHRSLHFDGDEVVLEFDEFIRVEDPTNRLIITPSLKEEVDFKIRKYSVTVRIKDTLEANTTYTFNFADAIKDITEGNIARDASLAFSTGDYLDSVFVPGSVTDLLNNKPLENVIVALYDPSDTLDIFNSKPVYFTRSRPSGLFLLENLKNVPYRIYAYEDSNRDLKVDPSNERYGFLKTILNDSIPIDSTSVFRLHIQKLDISELEMISARPSGVYFEVKLNKPVIDYNLSSDEAPQPLAYLPIEDNKAVRIFNTFPIEDSLKIEVIAIDSVGFTLEEKVWAKFPETLRSPEALSQSFTPGNNKNVDALFKGEFLFNKPIRDINTDSIFFELDSTEYIYLDSQTDFEWNKYRTKVQIEKFVDPKLLEKIKLLNEEKQKEQIAANLPERKLDSTGAPVIPKEVKSAPLDSILQPPAVKVTKIPPMGYRLYIAAGSFITVENDSSSKIDNIYVLKDSRNYGLIKGNIVTNYKSFVIQLLDSKNEVVDERSNTVSYQFKDVSPGEYRIRILVDENNNNKWDPGNILELTEPEKVVFYPEVIPVKKNWELDNDPINF